MTIAAIVVAVGALVVAAVAVRRSRSLERQVAAAADLERQRDQLAARVASGRAESDRIRAALDAVPRGIVLVGADGAPVLENRTAGEVAGSRHGEAIVRDALAAVVADVRAGGSGRRTVELFGPPRRVVEVQGRPIGEQVVVVIEDVTDARRLDEARRDLVANVSHELKTPIAAIGLLAETLAGERDPVVAARLAERMVDESFRVGSTIEDVLELSRIEGGGTTYEPVSVTAVVAGAVDRVRPAADQRGIALEVTGAPEDLTVPGERRQLVSAVANLLDNAVKYSNPASTVTVRAFASGGRATIEVEDHGLGIPSRDVDRIFERFYRVDRARSRDTGGTGLGLSIVRHVVANHGGEVTVRSQEGAGSTFTLLLPSASVPKPEEATVDR